MSRTSTPILIGLALLALLAPVRARGQAQTPDRIPVLTADRAVQLALQRNTQIVAANANVLTARSGLYGAYTGVLPSLTATLARDVNITNGRSGSQLFATILTPSTTTDNTTYSTTPTVGGRWTVLNLANIAGLSSARAGMKASLLQRQSTRADVALATRQQYYQVVQAAKLIEVTSNALKVARDSERRVQTMFEVGSVARNDVLQAQVQTAQSALDSIAAVQSLVVQRDLLATQIGLDPAQIGEVDTVLTFTPLTFDEPALLREAAGVRADIRAAREQARSSRAAVASARFSRLPYVTASGSFGYRPFSATRQKLYGDFPTEIAPGDTVVIHDPVRSTRSRTDRQYAAELALNWDFFSGLTTESEIARARAQLLTSQNALAVLERNLAGEVHEAALTYQQSLASEATARAGVAAAAENLNLTQQKYNVGSATILDLVTAQVALERAQSQLVNALTAIRVAEARIERVRGIVP